MQWRYIPPHSSPLGDPIPSFEVPKSYLKRLEQIQQDTNLSVRAQICFAIELYLECYTHHQEWIQSQLHAFARRGWSDRPDDRGMDEMRSR